jgi:putative Ig domain-containing protein
MSAPHPARAFALFLTIISPATLALAQTATGAITGTVTCTGPHENFGTDQPLVLPQAYNVKGEKAGNSPAFLGIGCGQTYRIQDLAPGIYYVSTSTQAFFAGVSPTHPRSGDLIGELYDDVPCVSTDCDATRGTPITVTAGATTSGIDFVLKYGGSFGGQMCSGGDTAIVEVYDSQGTKLEGRYRRSSGVSCGPGIRNYEVVGLPTGVYFARVVAGGYMQAYNNACSTCAPTSWTPIVVREGQNTTVDLFAPDPVLIMSGTVRDDATASGLSGITVNVVAPDGRFAGAGTTDASGIYRVGRLTPGTYYAYTRNARGYIDERYKDGPCAGCGVEGSTPITVPTGTDVTGIDFSLAAGAQIQGKVTDSGGVAIAGAPVSLFDAAGTLVERTASDAAGAYGAAVIPGTSYARSGPLKGYRHQLYRDLPCPGGSCDPRTGTPIAASSSVTGVDFRLPACAVFDISPARLAPMIVGLAYRQQLTAGFPGIPYSVVSASLPSGVTLNSSGLISGTPLAASSSTFTVSAYANDCATTRTYRADVLSCSLTPSLSTTAFIPTAPGPGVLRIDSGPDYVALPAAGGRVDMGYLGNCDPNAVFAGATVSDSWIHVSGPTFVRGQPQPAGQITVDANPSATAPRTGFVVMNGRVIAVRQAPIDSAAPIGALDAPIDGSTVTGSVPVGGWALDDLGVSRIRIFRAPVPPEAAGTLIFIGEGSFVRGARPDVERIFRSTNNSDRAGWGYLLLSNVLPNQGNGQFTLYAYADDPEGHSTLIGTKNITADNAHATIPFGTIDTPAEGATVSGNAYVSFGWALTPQPKAIPMDGSTIKLSIDSTIIGSVDYNHFRQDVYDTFPTLANSNGAVGFRVIDTTQLTDGMHTIGWLVTDNLGAAAGIGSRYFTVLNSGVSSSSLTASNATAASPGVGAVRQAASLSSVPAEKRRIVSMKPLERVELDLSTEASVKAVGGREDGCAATYAGYDVTLGELRNLPVGSSLDRTTGRFAWQPGPGFMGSYELLFVRTSCDGTRERIPVRVTISD